MFNEKNKILRWFSGKIAESIFLKNCKRAHELNLSSWKLPTKQKIMASLYIVMKDYADGKFPPKATREDLHKAEIAYSVGEGEVGEDSLDNAMRVPFGLGWSGWGGKLRNTVQFLKWLDIIKLPYGSMCMELGCGNGWLSEIACLCGYNVIATALSEFDIQRVNLRSTAIKAKQLSVSLHGIVCPMEDVYSYVKPHVPFKLVFCHGALHHSSDWRETMLSVSKCMLSGSYVLICDEPSWHHTIICYRTCKITGRHEIGIPGRTLRKFMHQIGYSTLLTKRMYNPALSQWFLFKKQ